MRSTVVGSRKLFFAGVTPSPRRRSNVSPAAPAAVSLSISRRETLVDSLDIHPPGTKLRAIAPVTLPQIVAAGHAGSQEMNERRNINRGLSLCVFASLRRWFHRKRLSRKRTQSGLRFLLCRAPERLEPFSQRLRIGIDRRGIQHASQELQRVLGTRSESTPNVIRAAHQMILVRYLVVPKQAMYELGAFVDVERVQITDVDVNPQARGANLVGVRNTNRRRIVRFPVCFVQRLAEDCLHQLVASIKPIPRLHVFPLQSGIDARLERRESFKPVGVFEPEPQCAQASHRDSEQQGALPFACDPVGLSQVLEERPDEERLPLLRAILVVHVERSSGAWRNDYHLRQSARLPHFVDSRAHSREKVSIAPA